MLRFVSQTRENAGTGIASSRAVHKNPRESRHSISDARVFRTHFTAPRVMKVRVLRVPPSRILEGIDLRPYNLREGGVYDLESPVANVLIVWKYAERVKTPRGVAKTKR
jgi:hypothetical protein